MLNEEYIKKWLENSLTDEEKKIFESTDEYKSLEKLDRSLRLFKAPDYDVEEELRRLQNRKKGKGKVASLQWLSPLVKIAAVFLILITGYFFFYLNTDTVFQTTAMEKKNIFLPDSSTVSLNAETQLSFKKNIWQYSRQVQLDGEAFFSVAKGSRFDVETSSGTISVLGTQFNVKNRDDYFEVVCFEGLVQVNSSYETDKLTPGRTFRIVNGKVEKLERKTYISPDWLANESSFHSVPFSQVIKEFERQYGISIKTQGLDTDQLFTGTFIHGNRELALQAISIPFNLHYEVSDREEIILTTKGD